LISSSSVPLRADDANYGSSSKFVSKGKEVINVLITKRTQSNPQIFLNLDVSGGREEKRRVRKVNRGSDPSFFAIGSSKNCVLLPFLEQRNFKKRM
jgi:hypothetical protein